MSDEKKDLIVLVEDEPDILDMVRYNLERAGYRVLTSEEGEGALPLAQDHKPSLVILDLMLPGMDGLDVCKALRSDPGTRDIPILILTARKDEVDRVLGFELGADDYVVKPFSPRELVLRVKAILRRAAREEASGRARLRIGPLVIDRDAHHVELEGESVTLTATEFRLLVTLVERKGRVQSREDLLNSVWGYEYAGYGRTVDTHIRRLREKLGDHADVVETVRGVGYRFNTGEA